MRPNMKKSISAEHVFLSKLKYFMLKYFMQE